jgi:FkbM family methyltransferase
MTSRRGEASVIAPGLAVNLKRTVKGGLRYFGLDISRYRPPELQPPLERRFFEALLKIRESDSEFLKYCAGKMDRSHAQLFQDLLVLFLLDEKRSGYFVEFGAMDGIRWSNTFLLETDYGWNGIVAEPARSWHDALRRNRRCSVDQKCVWSKSGDALQFNETVQGEFSTIDSFSRVDGNAAARQSGTRYMVEAISLRDLLHTHDAPMEIDYLSIDTEGSELSILASFFPDPHDVRIITVEHNHTEQRSRIFDLLTSFGYRRLFAELSMWDDWYIKDR